MTRRHRVHARGQQCEGPRPEPVAAPVGDPDFNANSSSKSEEGRPMTDTDRSPNTSTRRAALPFPRFRVFHVQQKPGRPRPPRPVRFRKDRDRDPGATSGASRGAHSGLA